MIKQLEAFGVGKAEVFSELRSRQYLEMQGQRAERGAPLRNEIRSVIASQYGIFEASRYLRHSDIRITAAFYADKKQRVIPDLT